MFETYFILPFLTAHHEFDISQIIGNSQGIQSVWGMGLWQSTLCPASLWCCFALLGRSSLRGSGKGWPFGVWDDEVIGSGRENKSCSIWLSRISFSIIFHLNHNCWKIIIIPIILNTIHFLRIQKPLHLISSYVLLGERSIMARWFLADSPLLGPTPEASRREKQRAGPRKAAGCTATRLERIDWGRTWGDGAGCPRISCWLFLFCFGLFKKVFPHLFHLSTVLKMDLFFFGGNGIVTQVCSKIQ